MIEHLASSFYYWALLAFFYISLNFIFKGQLLTPNFIISFFLAQSAAALVLNIIEIPYISITGALGVIFFVIGFSFSISKKYRNYVSIKASRIDDLLTLKAHIIVLIITIIILLYFGIDSLFASDSIISSLTQTEDERAIARKENKIILFIQLLTPYFIALTLSSRFISSNFKFLVIIMTVIVGTLSGSKAGFFSIILIYAAIVYWHNIEVKVVHKIVLIALSIFAPLLVFLLSSERFGISADDTQTFLDLINLFLYKILYRIVANNDSLELLIDSGRSIYDYPFYGPFQLVDPILKMTGLRSIGFEYSPGEWLYGINFGNFSGVGPNPTFLIEFPQALGPASIFLMYFLGIIFRLITSTRGSWVTFPIYLLFPSVLFDISLFEMKLIVYFLSIFLVYCAVKFMYRLNRDFFMLIFKIRI